MSGRAENINQHIDDHYAYGNSYYLRDHFVFNVFKPAEHETDVMNT